MVECVLSTDHRITLAYGSIVSASLSIFGSLGTIFMILLANRARKQQQIQKVQHQQQQQEQLLNDNKSQLSIGNHSSGKVSALFQPLITSSTSSLLSFSESAQSSLSTSPNPSTTHLSNSFLFISNNDPSSISASATSIDNISTSGGITIVEDDLVYQPLLKFKPTESNYNSLRPTDKDYNDNYYYQKYNKINGSSNRNNRNKNSKSNNKNNSNDDRESKDKVTKYLVHLSCSDLLASLLVLVSRILLIKYDSNFNKTPKSDFSMCSVSSGLVGFAFLSSIIWTATIAFHTYRLFTTSVKNKNIDIFYYLISWGIPFSFGIGLMPNAYLEELDGFKWCTVSVWALLGLYYIPMILSIVTSVVLTIKINQRFKHLSNSLSVVNISKIRNRVVQRLILFVCVFVLCWSVNIVSFLILLFNHRCEIFIIEFLSQALSPLQGFLNFLCYIYSNRKEIPSSISRNNSVNTFKPSVRRNLIN